MTLVLLFKRRGVISDSGPATAGSVRKKSRFVKLVSHGKPNKKSKSTFKARQ